MQDTAHAPAGLRIMYIIWGWLLAITLVEVFLAYEQFPLMVMLLALLGLSIMKAGMIMSWFMHLKFERLNLALTIIPAMIMCMILMNAIWPEARRVRSIGVFRDLPAPVPTAPGEAEPAAPPAEGGPATGQK